MNNNLENFSDHFPVILEKKRRELTSLYILKKKRIEELDELENDIFNIEAEISAVEIAYNKRLEMSGQKVLFKQSPKTKQKFYKMKIGDAAYKLISEFGPMTISELTNKLKSVGVSMSNKYDQIVVRTALVKDKKNRFIKLNDKKWATINQSQTNLLQKENGQSIPI